MTELYTSQKWVLFPKVGPPSLEVMQPEALPIVILQSVIPSLEVEEPEAMPIVILQLDPLQSATIPFEVMQPEAMPIVIIQLEVVALVLIHLQPL